MLHLTVRPTQKLLQWALPNFGTVGAPGLATAVPNSSSAGYRAVGALSGCCGPPHLTLQSSRPRLFSVEKTGNFARLRQASKLLRASRADGTPCHAENGRNCQFSRAGGVPQLVCYGQQERPISSTASSCTTRYWRLIPSAFADKKPDLANL